MKKLIAHIILAGIVFSANAQQYPYFSQYLFNPYVYNPAMLGNSGYNEVNFTYRQQWLGINDAPTTQAFNFHFPTKNSFSFGASFYNDKAVLLSTSALMFGAAYQVSFDSDHYLKFGLSTGVGMNNFDLGEVDNPNDPALNDVLSKTSFLSGQFGIHYNFRGLKFGFSLPQLYKYSAIDTSDFQKVTIDQLDNFITTASYRFQLNEGRLGLEPFAMYRKSELLPSILEVGTMLDYKELFWVGGSYRKDYGGTGFLGVNIKRNISFSYAYEFAGGQQVSLGNGSHELNFKVRFGKNKHKKMRMLTEAEEPATSSYSTIPDQAASEGVAPVVDNTKVPQAEQKNMDEPGFEETSMADTDAAIIEESIISSAEMVEKTKKVHDPNYNKPKPTFSQGYYVVLGAFEIFDNAITYVNMLRNKGIQVDYGYVKDRNLYYIFNTYTHDLEEASKIQNQFKQLNDFQDAWIFGVNENGAGRKY